ncbi:MAG: class D sortase [Peptostreptococcaceae bacterium]|nr:class D sortase [Peptostreptococcaceae bacterium]
MNKNRFSILLIIIGVILICVPLIGGLYNNYQQDKLYTQYEKNLAEEFAALDKTLTETVSGDGIDVASESDPNKELDLIDGIMGRINIPAISSDLLLIEGSSSKQLKWGAGHVTGTAMPGEAGNCAIAAHRNYTFGTYFSRLNELKVGDEIDIEYKGKSYKYRVTDSFVVDPDEVWVLGKTEKPIITLITCHPRGSGTKRLIVRGELLD